jgi:cellulose synthase/poly-beta-1,6-N-acetylglucosamine synthase-like glycosyltransferase
MTGLALMCAAASVACLALAAHPFATYPLTLRALARQRPRPLAPAPASRQPAISVCICAYNEAAVIAARIDNLLEFRNESPDLEILIYVDGATDETADIAAGYGDRIVLVHSSARLGKTHGMNTLVARARGDIVVFSDANVTFAADALQRLAAPFADPLVGCVCGHLIYTATDGATAATGSLYWRLEEHIKALESATGSVMGADGSIFAIRRALHVPPPPHLIDDMYVSLSVLCRGARVVRAGDAHAFEPAVAAPHDEFRRKIRIACQAFNVHRALWPALRHLPAVELYKYVSHKPLRWLTIYFLGGAALFAMAGLAAAGAWALLAMLCATGLLCGAVLALAHNGPAARLTEIFGAFLATGIGVVRSLRGERFQTWTPPASARYAVARSAE